MSILAFVDARVATRMVNTGTGTSAAQPDAYSDLQVANMIRPTVSAFNRPFPAVLEIPSKDCPYDPSQDSILSRVQFMFGAQ